MKLNSTLPLAFAMVLGGCAAEAVPTASQPPRDTVITLGDGARISYYSRRPRRPAEERSLAVRARRTFCGHYPDLDCEKGGIVFLAISSTAASDCFIIATGEKYRIADPRQRMDALAEFDCPTDTDRGTYSERLFATGTAGVLLDGPMAPRPRDLAKVPVIAVDRWPLDEPDAGETSIPAEPRDR